MSNDGDRPHLVARLPDGLCQLLQVLGNETRLKVLFAVAAGERDVSSVWRSLGLRQEAASHHLGVLRQASLVLDRRDGKHVYYRLGPCVRADGRDAIVLDCMEFGVTLRLRRRGRQGGGMGGVSPRRMKPGRS
jgi:DNA-binding transcriptional ArsR family regulator